MTNKQIDEKLKAIITWGWVNKDEYNRLKIAYLTGRIDQMQEEREDLARLLKKSKQDDKEEEEKWIAAQEMENSF